MSVGYLILYTIILQVVLPHFVCLGPDPVSSKEEGTKLHQHMEIWIIVHEKLFYAKGEMHLFRGAESKASAKWALSGICTFL